MSSPVPLTGTYIIFSLISYCYFMTDSIRMLISQLYSYVISTHMQLCTGTNNLFSHVLFTAYEFLRAPVFFIHRYPLSLNCYPTFFLSYRTIFFHTSPNSSFCWFPLIILGYHFLLLSPSVVLNCASPLQDDGTLLSWNWKHIYFSRPVHYLRVKVILLACW